MGVIFDTRVHGLWTRVVCIPSFSL